ncbi:hypothetical protein FSARC_9040 [Fusarium sarcochroum]|uniref:Uncharacterized protein n=1 Tax=Fusarium sarcochroum TaxID=1208366 RepID=A0A8H4X6H7_9HYPO|nr:hypothetical protein FSARC_9040 [Fusarium sarcochroum]
MSDSQRDSGNSQRVTPSGFEMVSLEQFYGRIGPNVRRTFENMATSTLSDLERFGHSTNMRNQPEREATDRANSAREAQDAAQQTENRRLLDRIEVLEAENLALKQKLTRLESKQD